MYHRERKGSVDKDLDVGRDARASFLATGGCDE